MQPINSPQHHPYNQTYLDSRHTQPVHWSTLVDSQFSCTCHNIRLSAYDAHIDHATLLTHSSYPHFLKHFSGPRKHASAYLFVPRALHALVRFHFHTFHIICLILNHFLGLRQHASTHSIALRALYASVRSYIRTFLSPH